MLRILSEHSDTRGETLIKRTSSLCPLCKCQIDADVIERDGRIYLTKSCPEHGDFDVLINSDKRYYYKSIGSGGGAGGAGGGGGCGAGCACDPKPDLSEGPDLFDAQVAPGNGKSGPSERSGFGRDESTMAHGGHDPTIIEHASTCIALIEIVTSCNLKCPTCYADSPFSDPGNVDALPFDEIVKRVDAVIARKGMIDILQLSGGEPTIHPRFLDVARWAMTHPKIGYILLTTNGVRIATDAAFAEALGALRREHKRLELYLQFDGVQPGGQRELRGADLRALREQAIDTCARIGIPVTLAMTVNDTNLPHLGDTLRFGLARRAVRGITFQPMFGSGRVAKPPAPPGDRYRLHPPNVKESSANTVIDPPALPGALRATPLNVADVIHGLIDQSRGLLCSDDFTPLPCGDPNCHTVGYAIRRGDAIIPVSRVIDFSQVQGFLENRVNFNLEDLERCGCETEPLGSILKQLEIGPDDVFRLFIKPFMDAWTYDQHRIDRCCVHVVGEGGSLESFCRHYALRA